MNKAGDYYSWYSISNVKQLSLLPLFASECAALLLGLWQVSTVQGNIQSVICKRNCYYRVPRQSPYRRCVGESNVEESVQSQTTGISRQEEKKEFIKYVEFNVTYAALDKALQIDIKSHEENAEVKISWIDLLAYLGAKYGGDFSRYQSSDMDALVEKLQSGETMESLTEGMQYYAYYSKAYTAVLGRDGRQLSNRNNIGKRRNGLAR